jgi:hypothetical protein
MSCIRSQIALVLALFVSGCAVAPEEAERFEESEQGIIGVWEEASSIAGLPGTYSRSSWGLPNGAMTSMTLMGKEIGGGTFEGPYTRVIKGVGAESGTYNALPTNPAIGFAFIRFAEMGNPDKSKVFVISRLQRLSATKIYKLELREVSENDLGAPFVVTRVGL